MVDTTEQVEELVKYYQNLLIMQYRDKPKANATIELFARQILQDGIYFKLLDAFNIDLAIGHQLDILGKWIGVDRFFKGQDFAAGTYFAFCKYTTYNDSIPDGSTGFANYDNFLTKPGKFIKYENVISNTEMLNDVDFRLVLKLKIILNSINMSQSAIDEALYLFFGNGIVFSSKNDMSFYYIVDAAVLRLATVLLEKKVLPKPLGVRLNGFIKKSDYFGFSSYATFNAPIPTGTVGFANYDNFDTKSGKYLEYSDITLI